MTKKEETRAYEIMGDLALTDSIRRSAKRIGLPLAKDRPHERAKQRAMWKELRSLTHPSIQKQLRHKISLLGKELYG
jgi:hypothetical protein